MFYIYREIQFVSFTLVFEKVVSNLVYYNIVNIFMPTQIGKESYGIIRFQQELFPQ